jgi:hypothetical protein
VEIVHLDDSLEAPEHRFDLDRVDAAGTASIARFTESFASPQLLHMMSAASSSETSGSIQSSPVAAMSRPATTTPADAAASPSMWMNAPRMLRSCSRPRMNASAVPRLIAMPTVATTDTTPPAIGADGGTARRLRR